MIYWAFSSFGKKRLRLMLCGEKALSKANALVQLNRIYNLTIPTVSEIVLNTDQMESGL